MIKIFGVPLSVFLKKEPLILDLASICHRMPFFRSYAIFILHSMLYLCFIRKLLIHASHYG